MATPRPHLVTGVAESRSRRSGRLPRERDAFLGRDLDLRRIADALSGPGFVTLLGPGGMGKTRLACRFAWSRLEDWPDGAWFCDLSAARDVADVAAELARALDVPPGGDAVTQAVEALRGRGRALVVLDNAETATEAVAAALSRWLDAAPAVRFLVTSREALRIAGESVLPLESLDDDAAAALFADRAAAADPSFVAAEHADTIVEIARRLDGMPLAIELAAARVRVLPPPKLLDRLSRRFEVLTGGRRDDPRHNTLRAALDWSWDLLDEAERAAFARLAVFVGGFDADAAEAVIAEGPGRPPALDLLEALVDKSLVRRLANGRLALFPTIAAYADERLPPDERADAELRQSRWYTRLDAPLRGEAALERLAELEADAENLAASARSAIARGDAPVAASLASALARLARIRPYAHLAGPLIEATVAMPGHPKDARWSLLCDAATIDGRAAGVERLLAAAAEAREAGDALAEAKIVNHAVALGTQVGRHEDVRDAVTRLRELIARLPEADHGRVIRGLALWTKREGNVQEGMTLSEQLLAVAAEEGDPWIEAAMLANTGWSLCELGQFERSRERLERAAALHRDMGNGRNLARTKSMLGTLAARQGRFDEAAANYEESRRVAAGIGEQADWINSTGNLASTRTSQGRHDEAVALAREALAAAERAGTRWAVAEMGRRLGQSLSARGDHAEALATIRRAVDQARELGGGAPFLANMLGIYSEVLTRSGDAYEAIVPLHEALVLARDAGHPLTTTYVLIWLSDAYHALGDLARARLYAQDAVAIASGVELEEAKRRLERARG